MFQELINRPEMY